MAGQRWCAIKRRLRGAVGRGRPPRGRASQRRLVAGLLVLIVMGSAVWVAVATSIQPATLLYLVYVGVSLVLGAIAVTTLVWMLHAWRTPDSFAESRLHRDDRESAHSFSLIVPARHEQAVLEVTLGRLVQSDHPAFEVLVVVGADDPATREVAERMADRHSELVKVVVDSSWPKNKPKALNAALPYCTGAVTGVFDAEDDVHPALLQQVDRCFQQTDADVVQAGVQLMNFRSSWLTVHNVLEYYFWFRSRLRLHARQRFIPLGGNTVFIRTEILRAVAGWDADCLAEDCELGVRLSALGARTVVFYEPELVTREECPPTLRAFVRQRTRWNQGYLQTLSRGYWRRLPLRQRALGLYILAMPYAMATTWLLIPVAIGSAVAVKAPVPVTLISFLPVLPMLSMLMAEVAGLGEFCRAYGERASIRDYGRLVLGLLPYQVVLAFAAARAVAREARGARGWDKTAHLGLHLAHPADVGSARSDPSLRVPSRRAAALGAAALGGLSRQVAALGVTAVGVLPWRARRPQRATTGPRDVEVRPVAYALAQSVASSHHTVEPNGDALSWSPVGAAAEAPPSLHYVEAWPGSRAGRAGNGRGDLRPRPANHLLGRVDGEPLWVRFDGASAKSSASLSPPRIRPLGLKGRASWLGKVRALLPRAVASRADVALPLALVAGVGVVVGTNLLHWPGTQFDEGSYVSYAWAVQHGRLANYTYSYGHPPLAWLLIFLWTEAGGIFGHASFSIDTGREFMFAVNLVSCSLLYVLGRRLGFSRTAAAIAVILFALCPLGVFYHRAVLLDNPSMAWAIAAFLLAWTPQRRLWAFAASGACFAASVLCKETAFVLLPALLVAVAQNADRRTRRYCLTLFASFFVLVGGFYPLYATLKGELLPGPGHVSLTGYLVLQLFTRQGTGSLFNPHSGTHLFVTGWLQLDPWLLGAALALSPIALARRTTRAVTLAYLIQLAVILRPGYLPAMYVISLVPFAALIVAGSIHALWRFATDDHPRRQLPSGQTAWRVIGARAAALLMPVAVAVSAVAIAAAAAVCALYVGPRWARADDAAMTVRLDGSERAAEHWLVQHVSHDQRIIVTDDFWIYLMEHGFNDQPMRGGFFSKTVVSFWPDNYDPAVKRVFPHGWRDFNYIVSTQGMLNSLTQNPTVVGALNHSRVVVSFGQGTQLIEIRAIIGARPATSRR